MRDRPRNQGILLKRPVINATILIISFLGNKHLYTCLYSSIHWSKDKWFL